MQSWYILNYEGSTCHNFALLSVITFPISSCDNYRNPTHHIGSVIIYIFSLDAKIRTLLVNVCMYYYFEEVIMTNDYKLHNKGY